MKNYFATLILCFVLPTIRSQTLSVNPNPFLQRTLASYTIASTDSVSLQLINVSGQVILTPVYNTILPAGTYQDSLLLDNFPLGIYYLVLKVKSGSPKTIKLIKQGPVGINEITFDASLNFFPNPIKDKLFLHFESSLKIDKISISNALGQIVHSVNNPQNNQEMDLGFLTEAIYYLKVENKTEQKFFKIVKE